MTILAQHDLLAHLLLAANGAYSIGLVTDVIMIRCVHFLREEVG